MCRHSTRQAKVLRFQVVTEKTHSLLSAQQMLQSFLCAVSEFFLYFTERKTRKRRQIMVRYATLRRLAASYPIIEPGKLCAGGKAEITANDVADCKYIQGKDWKVKCKIYTVSCYWITVCPTFDSCYRNHLINRSFCCEYICAQLPK